jgi:hypothetical protein
MEQQKSRKVKTILKKNEVPEIALLNFKGYSNFNCLHISTDRYINQGNRINSPDIDQHRYGQLVFGRDSKAIQ